MTRRIGVSVVAIAALVPLTAWLMNWPIERAIYLAPIIVVAVAALVGLFILWVKVAITSLRESPRPRLVLALWGAGILLVVLLTVLGIELPREGG